MARFQFLVYVIFVLINQVFGALNGDCSLEDVLPAHWSTSYTNEQVNDNHADVFHSFKATNVESVTLSTSGRYARYFTVTLTPENDVMVRPSADFVNLEQIEDSDASFTSIFVTLQFACNTGTGSLVFSQPIKDLNTYIPQFSETSYTYTLPMPLPSDFNIGCLASVIEVCDYDITNTRLDFSISPSEDFSVTWDRTTDERNKCHLAVISTKKSVRLTEEQTYVITVTDVGNPTQSNTASLTIQVDEQTSLPLNPQFESASYTATYNADTAEHSINLANPIHLEEGYSDINISLSGVYGDNFEATIGPDQISVILKANLPEEVLAKQSVVLVTIEATLKNAEAPGRAVLIVQLPEKPANPQFESASYTATYNDDGEAHSITVDGPIRLADVDGYSDIEVELLGEHSEHFEIKSESEEITVKLISNLPEEVLERNLPVLITIEGTIKDAEAPGRTVLVVELPAFLPSPQFEAASYTANYNSESPTHTITIQSTIRLANGYSGIELQLRGDYSQNFDAKPESNQIIVTLNNNLPDSVLEENSAVFLTIEAALEGAEEPGRTILIVHLPEKPPNPQFEAASYTATYNDDDETHSIAVDGPIRLVDKDEYSNIELKLLGEYSEHFEIQSESEEITIKLISNLPEEVLEKNLPVLVTIEATLKDAEAPGRTMLVVELPALLPSPQFEAASYTANYNAESPTHTITVQSTIRLTNGYSGIELQLQGDYSQNFEAKIESNQIIVTLTTNLPANVLDENSAVFITIEATLDGAEVPGRTILIVPLPEKPPNPQFEAASYTATYSDDGETHSISVDGAIRLANVDDYSAIRVDLLGEYQENFQAQVGSSQITVTLKSNLPENVLAEESSVLLTIEATLENAEAPGRTVLVVLLPKQPELPKAPQFEFASYTATYSIDNGIHSITVDDAIHLISGYTGIHVAVVGEYEENFEAAVGSDQVTVTLKSNLAENVLAEESSVLLTIEATLENAEAPGRTVLVVRLPKQPELPKAPQFEFASYTATYSIDNGIHSITADDAIHLISGYTGIHVAVVGEYEENFEAAVGPDQVTVTLKSNLPENVLAEASSVLLTIEATLENAEAPGRTVLVVRLPKQPELPPAPQFESASYTATYSIDNGIHSITVDDAIRLISGYSGIRVALVGENEENFEAAVGSDQITVTLKSNLPEHVLADESSVVLAMEATLEDSEVPGRTVLVVRLPKETELPPAPEFESLSYTATYTIENGIHNIGVKDAIRLKGEYSGITVALLGEYSDYFDVDIKSNEITVTLKSKLPGNVLAEDSSVIITIEATLEDADVSGKSVLVVQLPKDPELPSAPQFESSSYTATYITDNDIHVISVKEAIRLKGTHSGITVDLLGEHSTNFDAHVGPNEITVTLKSNLPGNVLAEESSVIITIEAKLTNGDVSGKTVLVVQLPKDTELPSAPQFESASYTATYNIDNGIHSITVDDAIRLISGYSGIRVALIGEHKDNFQAVVGSDQITVTLSSDLPENVLAEESSVVLTIEATLEDFEVPGRTVLVVRLPKPTELPPAPEFESLSYTATYSIEDGIHYIGVKDPIRLKGEYSGITVALLGEYSDNFDVDIGSNEITVILKSNLPGNVLAEDSSIIITIEATLEDGDASGETVLVVQLPKDPELPSAPQFESSSYTATYITDNDIHVISVEGAIRLKGTHSGITVDLLGEYSTNFDADVGPNEITVTLKSNLPGNILAEESSVIITIEAKLTNGDVSGKTALVVQLPKDTELPSAPQFESASYTATYNIDNGIHSITVDDAIRLISGYSGIRVALVGEHKDNFKAVVGSDQITVTLSSDLPENVLAEESSVVLTIEATLEDFEVPGRTVLVVRLPKPTELPPAPEFESLSYTATYSIEDGIHYIGVKDPIRLKGEYSGITVALLGEYSDNFDVDIGSNEITVILKSNLPGNVLAEDSSIIITIEATLEDGDASGKTVLVVQLPKDPELPSAPQFESSSYTATYITDNDIHVISVEGAIRLKGTHSGITVDLLGEYSTNFDAHVGPNEITVTLKSNLPGNILAEESSVIITIEAKLTNGDVSGKTALVVQLPKDAELPSAPQFESASYTATYSIDNGIHSINVDDAIHLISGYSGIRVALVGEYKDNFDADIGSNEITVTLKSNLPGNVLAEDSSVIITIEATLEDGDASGKTVLVVQLPKDPELPSAPQFEASSYTATYITDNDIHVISVKEAIRLKGTHSGITVDLLGEYSTNFDADVGPNEITVTLKSNLPGNVLVEESSVIITIEAKLTNGDVSGKTVLVVQLPKDPELPPTPQFESASYTATYSTDTQPHSISVDGTIRLEKGYADIELELLGDYKDNFKAEIVSDQIIVSVTENLPSDVLKEDSNILVTIEATLDNAAGPGRTVLVVELPEPPLTSVIKFEKDNYVYNTMEKYEGFIGFVRATAISEEPIKYSLEAADGASVPTELKYDDNTGALRIESELPIGEYPVIAVAKGTTSNAEGRASVVLYIYENTGELHTTDSVIIEHVSEKETEEIELPCAAEEGDCEYEIFEQYPETTPWLFNIRDGKLHCPSLDRQMDEVKDMLSPQYTVSLHLTKMGGRKIFGSRTLNYTSHQLSKRNADYPDNDREWVYIPKNVIKKPDQLLVSIIIEDINDNFPIFENEKLVVGYPTRELAIQLAPPYLAKVQATDLDAGSNAEIKYTTSSTHFVVHPKTGVIYPTEGALDDDSNLRFIITAIDRDGDDDGLRTDLEVEVIPLEQNHLAILTVTNIMLEDVDNKLQELSEKTGMRMKYLTAAVIPNINTYSKKTMPLLRDSSDHLTRIVVYALDSENDPVETDTIQQELEEAGMLEDISVDKWSPSSGGGNATDNCEEPSVAGFIAAVSVLASLLIIFVIAVAALYYFKIYRVRLPQPYDNMDEEDAGSITFEKSSKASTLGPSDKIATRRPTEFAFSPPPIEEDEDNEFGEEKPKYENPVDFYVEMKDEKNDLYSTPLNYSADTGLKSKAEDKHIHFTDTTVSAPAYDPIGAYEEDEFGERKLKSEDSPPPDLRDRAKSVTFKPTVEKINIVVDDKADDIFDERL